MASTSPNPVRAGGMESRDDRQHQCTSITQLLPALEILGHIDLDPASNPHSMVPARRHCVDPNAVWGELPQGFHREDGLAVPWGDLKVWLQPNFNKLGPWMDKLKKEPCAEVVAFLPARTHRVWFEKMWEADVLCFAKPSAFAGQEHCAPFPMIYAYFGKNRAHARKCLEKYGYVVPEKGTSMEQQELKTVYESNHRQALLETMRANPTLSVREVASQLGPMVVDAFLGMTLDDLLSFAGRSLLSAHAALEFEDKTEPDLQEPSREDRILGALRHVQAERGCGCTVADVCDAIGDEYSSFQVKRALKKLEATGQVTHAGKVYLLREDS